MKIRDILSKEKFFILSIFIIAFCLRIFYSFSEKIAPFADARVYDKIAINISQGKGYVKWEGISEAEDHDAIGYPPLYPFFLALVYKVIGHNYSAIWVLQAIIGAVTCILIYLFGKITFGKIVASFSAIVATFHFDLVIYNAMLLTETLYIFLVLVTFFYLFKAFEQRINMKYYLVAGVFAGLSALTRPIIMIFLVFLVIWGLRQKENRRGILFFVFCLFLVISPWIIRNFLIYHQFIPITAGGENFWWGNNPQANGECLITDEMRNLNLSQLELNYGGYKRGLRFIAQHPGRFFLLALKKMSLFWSLLRIEAWWPHMQGIDRILSIALSFLFAAFILSFGILGIVFSYNEKNVHSFWLTNFIFLCPLSLVPFFVEARYRLPIYPFMIIFASYGLTLLPQIKSVLKSKEEKNLKCLKISVILIAILLLNSIYDLLSCIDEVGRRIYILKSGIYYP